MRQKTPVILARYVQIYQLNHARSIAQINTKTADEIQEGVQPQEWAKAKPTSAIPGPTKYELIRGFLPGGMFFQKPFLDFMRVSRELYGDFFHIPGVFGKPDFVTSFNPDDFSVAIRSEGAWPRRRGFDTMKFYRKEQKNDVFGEIIGLLGSNGADWGKLRSAVNPVLMQSKNVRLYIDKMLGVNDEFLERIREIRDPNTLEMPANFEDEMNRLTFESVAVVALNQQMGVIRHKRDDAEVVTLFKSLRQIINLSYELDIMPSIWPLVKTPKFYQLMKAHDNMCEITMKYINQALERIENESKTNASGIDGEKSVLEKLLKIDKRVAIVMALDLLMGGVDTMSSTLTGILLCLAKSPEKQEKLRQEIRSILPEKDSKLTLENMKNLPYLRACIKEAIRIYPITTGSLRSNVHDIVLSGYQIPKNSDILLNSNMILMEEKYYSRPKEFLPERWLRTEEEADTVPANPFIYTPFGFGPRSCIGKRLVDLEMEITVSRLVRNFNLEYNYPTENAFKNHLINVPAIPLKFKLTDVEN